MENLNDGLGRADSLLMDTTRIENNSKQPASQVIELPLTSTVHTKIMRDAASKPHIVMMNTFKANDTSNHKRSPLKYKRQLGERNSLESINSKCSVSSGGGGGSGAGGSANRASNDDSPQHHNSVASNKQRSSAPKSETGKSAAARKQPPHLIQANQVAEARNRYVSPPKLALDKEGPEADGGPPFSDNGTRLVAMMSANNGSGRDCQHQVDSAKINDNLSRGGQGERKRSTQSSIKELESLNQNNEDDEDPKPPFVFAGILASVLGSIMFSFSTLFIKLLPDSDGFEEKAKALFFRGIFMMVFCGTTIICRGNNFLVPRDEIWVNTARAVFGTVGVFGSYCALKYISIGDATAIIFSSPIWTSILSHFILNEPIQWIQLIALPISLLGIILIAHPALIVHVDHLSLTKPPLSTLPNGSITDTGNQTLLNKTTTTAAIILQHDNHNINVPLLDNGPDIEQRWPGIVIALLVSLVVSGTYIVLKYRKKTPIQTTTFWLSFFVVFCTLIFMSIFGFGEMPSGWEWALLVGNGVVSWLGQSCLQWAFLHESASILSILRTLDVAITFSLSALFLDEDIYWTSIVGAAIISMVVVSIVFNNWLQKLSCMNLIKTPEATETVPTNCLKEANLMPDQHLSKKLLLDASAKAESPYIISTNKI